MTNTIYIRQVLQLC